jgi:hypothetical protein
MKRMLLSTLAAALLGGCATTAGPTDGSAVSPDEVRVFNVNRTGGETPPRTLDGCEALGSVSATVPETEMQAHSIGVFDPSVLLPTIRARAARKSADTVVVSFAPGLSESGRRTLRGNAFRCGDRPLPPELGQPLRVE